MSSHTKPLFFASSLMGPHFPPLTLLATLCLHTPLLPFERTHAGWPFYIPTTSSTLLHVCNSSQSNHAEMQCNCANASYHSLAPSLSHSTLKQACWAYKSQKKKKYSAMKNVCSNSLMGWCNFKLKILHILDHHPHTLTQNVISAIHKSTQWDNFTVNYFTPSVMMQLWKCKVEKILVLSKVCGPTWF